MDFSRVSQKHGVPAALIYGMWDTESDCGKHPGTFVRHAKHTDYGHFQVTAPTRRDLIRAGCKNPWSLNAETAADGPAHYLHSLKERYNGDWMKAVAAYNWGMKRIDDVVAAHGDNWYAHCRSITKRYVPSVMFAKIDPKMFEAGLLDDNQEIARQLGMRPDELRKTARSLMKAGLIKAPHLELDMGALLSDDAVSDGTSPFSGLTPPMTWQGSASTDPQTVSPAELLPPPSMIRPAAPVAQTLIQPVVTDAKRPSAPVENAEPVIVPPPIAPKPVATQPAPVIQPVAPPAKRLIASVESAAPVIVQLPIASKPVAKESAPVIQPVEPPAKQVIAPVRNPPIIQQLPVPAMTPSQPPPSAPHGLPADLRSRYMLPSAGSRSF